MEGLLTANDIQGASADEAAQCRTLSFRPLHGPRQTLHQNSAFARKTHPWIPSKFENETPGWEIFDGHAICLQCSSTDRSPTF